MQYSKSTKPTGQSTSIDRHAWVSRHNVRHTRADARHFLQVGNGEFAYAMDVTGFQTLDRLFNPSIPLHTMSNWGWHRFPGQNAFEYEQTMSPYYVNGRTVPYADQQDTPAGAYFRANPHRVNLARISLWWEGLRCDDINLDEFSEVDQELDLWHGCVTSRYKFRGKPVTVETISDPQLDAVAFRIESPLLSSGKLGVAVRFSYPAGVWGPHADDFSKPELHTTRWSSKDMIGGTWTHSLDDLLYAVDLCSRDVKVKLLEPHLWRLTWPQRDCVELCFTLHQQPSSIQPTDFQSVYAATIRHWESFWTDGGAVDFGDVDDPRADEIERRVVLSLYLTAIQNGSLPPQETGLVCNSWFGKHHLEMHWWHAAHFPLWGRPEILVKSLAWYNEILTVARDIAQQQGYRGVRWPKMCGPDGVSSPSTIAVFLVWQQPHIIYFAELLYRANPTLRTLDMYMNLVDQTAQFMADFVLADEYGVYHLPSPLACAQECYKPEETSDPTYELAYWHWGLSVAQLWRQRSGQPRNVQWDHIINHLAKPAIRDGSYMAVGVEPFLKRTDHPSMLCALGVLPHMLLIDPVTMQHTADSVQDDWDWGSTWGWDFPVIAMTRARCGQPDSAIEALLMDCPRNHYLPNGYNGAQTSRLPIYLPGNGGMLTAIAMMAAGWDGAPHRSAPGFPENWRVYCEGVLPLLM